jgi:pimeloyl-ACP methyl ester carboxylesterase
MRIFAPALLVSYWFLTAASAPAVGEEKAAPAAAPTKSEAPPPAAEQFKREEVTFQNGAVTLSGDLLTPIGPGPFPAFVWCHGSGAANRRWGMSFASTFIQAGYAFLTWDKPGVGKSSGRHYQQSLTNRADEVLAAAEMLKQRKEIDPERISFCGASQAGFVLPRAIKAFPKAERLVLVGPGSWSFSEERAYQQKTAPMKKYLPMVGLKDPRDLAEAVALYEKVNRVPDSEFVEAYLRFHEEAKDKP